MPLFTIDVDFTPLQTAIAEMPEVLRGRVLEACRITAEAIVTEAKARLARQLSPAATGATVAGIHAQLAYDGNGYVVLADRDPLPTLPLWLEKGTHVGARANDARTPPRPFFYPAIELEASDHERRLLDAMREAAAAVGLGGS